MLTASIKVSISSFLLEVDWVNKKYRLFFLTEAWYSENSKSADRTENSRNSISKLNASPLLESSEWTTFFHRRKTQKHDFLVGVPILSDRKLENVSQWLQSSYFKLKILNSTCLNSSDNGPIRSFPREGLLNGKVGDFDPCVGILMVQKGQGMILNWFILILKFIFQLGMVSSIKALLDSLQVADMEKSRTSLVTTSGFSTTFAKTSSVKSFRAPVKYDVANAAKQRRDGSYKCVCKKEDQV